MTLATTYLATEVDATRGLPVSVGAGLPVPAIITPSLPATNVAEESRIIVYLIVDEVLSSRGATSMRDTSWMQYGRRAMRMKQCSASMK